MQLTGRADSFRGDDLVTLDTRLDRDFELGDTVVTLMLEGFNLFDEGTVLERELDLGLGRGGSADETLASRTFRLGFRVRWR